MRFLAPILVLAFGVAACAVGTAAGDGVVVKKSSDGGSSPSNEGGSSNNPPPSDQDSGSNQQPQTNPCSGSETQCGSDCVDLASDPSNCGGCGIACGTNETCTKGQCAGSQTNNGNAPPQGTCGHSLCTSGKALDEGCDTLGCTEIICDPEYLDDEFCCSSSWDAQCEQEVTDYCQPYSCN